MKQECLKGSSDAVFNLAAAVSQETMSPWSQCSELSSMYKVKCLCQPRSVVLPAKGSSRVVPVYCSTGRDSPVLFYKGCSHVSHVPNGASNEPLRSLKLYNHWESPSQGGVSCVRSVSSQVILSATTCQDHPACNTKTRTGRLSPSLMIFSSRTQFHVYLPI